MTRARKRNRFVAIAALQAGFRREIDTLRPACHIKHLAVVFDTLAFDTPARAREKPLIGRARPYSSVTRRTCWCPTTYTFRRRYGATQVANHPSLAY